MKLLVQCYWYLVILINLGYRKKVDCSSTYKAAVVEYHTEFVDLDISDDEKIILRARNHISLVEDINEDLEIILFPEKSLYSNENIVNVSTIIPKQMENICNSSDRTFKEYLKIFSCAAAELNTSIVINVIEKEIRTQNEVDIYSSTEYYNTVVAFNNEGRLVGRYRKWNLFGEFHLSQPRVMDQTVFTTKNNISFGIFNCFDIIFDTPPLNLTRDLKIKNILFPNKWISELPYLTALQVQQMWAQENDVVLLSSGGNDPKTGGSGTGIYVGKHGPLENVLIGGNGGSTVIVKTVPNLEHGDTFNITIIPEKYEDTDKLAKDLDDFFLLRDLSMDDHTSILLDENKKRVVETVCNGDSDRICCYFDVSITVNKTIQSRNQYKYHLAAFNGVRSFSGLRNAGIETCGIIACLNESLSSCALRFPIYSEVSWPITFNYISVEANFSTDNRIQYPTSLVSSLRPIPVNSTVWEKVDLVKFVKRRHVLNKPENRLLSFGIFGRDFREDDQQITNGQCKLSEKCIFTILLISNMFIYTFYLIHC